MARFNSLQEQARRDMGLPRFNPMQQQARRDVVPPNLQQLVTDAGAAGPPGAAGAAGPASPPEYGAEAPIDMAIPPSGAGGFGRGSESELEPERGPSIEGPSTQLFMDLARGLGGQQGGLMGGLAGQQGALQGGIMEQPNMMRDVLNMADEAERARSARSQQERMSRGKGLAPGVPPEGEELAPAMSGMIRGPGGRDFRLGGAGELAGTTGEIMSRGLRVAGELAPAMSGMYGTPPAGGSPMTPPVISPPMTRDWAERLGDPRTSHPGTPDELGAMMGPDPDLFSTSAGEGLLGDRLPPSQLGPPTPLPVAEPPVRSPSDMNPDMASLSPAGAEYGDFGGKGPYDAWMKEASNPLNTLAVNSGAMPAASPLAARAGSWRGLV